MIRLIALLLLLPFAALAEPAPRGFLGFGRVFTNDQLGDGQDRWRSGAYAVSALYGPAWDGSLPAAPGALLEWRLRSEVIAPDNLKVFKPADRRYVGLLDLSLLTHFQQGRAEVSLGAGLAVIGPQSGVGALQSWFHERLGLSAPEILAHQLGNRVLPHAEAEIARSYALGPVVLRPFAQAEAGTETLVRLGGDLVLGGTADALSLRDPVTGQRLRTLPKGAQSLRSLSLGADIAYVAGSAWLPAGEGPSPEPLRTRLRAGLEVQEGKLGLFYGATWLSPEFKGQTKGQVLGTVRASLSF